MDLDEVAPLLGLLRGELDGPLEGGQRRLRLAEAGEEHAAERGDVRFGQPQAFEPVEGLLRLVLLAQPSVEVRRGEDRGLIGVLQKPREDLPRLVQLPGLQVQLGEAEQVLPRGAAVSEQALKRGDRIGGLALRDEQLHGKARLFGVEAFGGKRLAGLLGGAVP